MRAAAIELRPFAIEGWSPLTVVVPEVRPERRVLRFLHPMRRQRVRPPAMRPIAPDCLTASSWGASSSRRVALGIFAAASAVVAAGCAAVKIPEYSSQSAPSPNSQSSEHRGVRMTVDPFLDEQRSREFFKVHAVRQGLIILHLRLENRGDRDTLLVQKSAFRLTTGAGTDKAASGGVVHSSGAADAIALSGAALLSLPLLFIGGKMAADADAIRQNFVLKELSNRTLAPGQSMDGFVYYQLPKSELRSGRLLFRVKIPTTEDREALVAEFPLAYEP